MHEFRGLSSRWKTPLRGFICVCRCIFGGLCCPFYFYFCIKYFHISNNLESPCFPVPVCLLSLRAGLSVSESPSLVFSGSICNCPCVLSSFSSSPLAPLSFSFMCVCLSCAVYLSVCPPRSASGCSLPPPLPSLTLLELDSGLEDPPSCHRPAHQPPPISTFRTQGESTGPFEPWTSDSVLPGKLKRPWALCNSEIETF